MISAMHRLPSPGADPVSLELMEHVCGVCETSHGPKMVVTKESFERAFTEHFEYETKRMITAAGVSGSRACVLRHLSPRSSVPFSSVCFGPAPSVQYVYAIS